MIVFVFLEELTQNQQPIINKKDESHLKYIFLWMKNSSPSRNIHIMRRKVKLRRLRRRGEFFARRTDKIVRAFSKLFLRVFGCVVNGWKKFEAVFRFIALCLILEILTINWNAGICEAGWKNRMHKRISKCALISKRGQPHRDEDSCSSSFVCLSNSFIPFFYVSTLLAANERGMMDHFL